MRILIAEDDADMRKIIRLYLEREGYEVKEAADGKKAVSILTEQMADLVILDWMMPVQDGMETLREIRKLELPVKVLMLTARGETKDEAAGLICGADDYLRKPFDIQILLLRIKKLCRGEDILRCGEISLNQSTGCAKRGEEMLELTKTEYSLLRFFLQNQNLVLSRETILDRVWGMDFEGDIRTVDTTVKRLRKKIGDDFIRTRIGLGYIMEGCHGKKA